MPFMRITRSRFDPANAEEVESIRPELAAALQGQPGLQHLHGGIDREGGRAVVVAIFDTREHAELPPRRSALSSPGCNRLGCSPSHGRSTRSSRTRRRRRVRRLVSLRHNKGAGQATRPRSHQLVSRP